MLKSHKCNTSFSREIVHVLKAVAIVTSEHLNLSTNLPLVSFCLLIKMSLEWRLKPGFGIQKKCSFPLKEMSLLTKVTNKKVMYVNIFLGLPLNFSFNSDVPREGPL